MASFSLLSCRPAAAAAGNAGAARGSSASSWMHHRLPRAAVSQIPVLGQQGAARRPSFVVKCMSSHGSGTADLIKSKNEHNPVVIYSKSWCPYCTKVKGLFKKLGVKVVVVELDELVEEADVQAALKRMTGQATVPSVFIGGKHVGGCDDTHRLHSQGELIPMLQGAKAQMQASS